MPTGSLPTPLSSFVGREREVTEVKRLLEAARLVTLTGTGGIGKTRLALEVARASADAVFVDLAPLVDGRLVPAAVAAAVGMREQSTVPLLELLGTFLASRELLLLLDNCEHVVAACAELAEHVLRACPRLRILATSREPLDVAGEQRWPVPSLSLPREGEASPISSEAERLFVERARLVQPGLALDEQTAPAIAAVCRRLDGIPLAIELAAARLPVLGVEQLAARLDACLHVLTQSSRTAPARHQTLRALVDWSVELLTDLERALFRRLAVFAGGWSLEMAEQICGGEGLARDQVLEVLARLVDKSLVIVSHAAGQTRYHLLETLRQYAAERLREAGEDDLLVRARHMQWCLALAERAAADLDGPRRAAWLERLEREHGNLGAALAWSLAQPARLEAALRLVGALGFVWWLGGHVQEGSRWLTEVLERPVPHGADDPNAAALVRARARALAPAAHLLLRQGDRSTARRLLLEARALARSVDARGAEANALLYLGQLALEDADPTAARSHLAAGLTLAWEQPGDGPPDYLFLLWLGHAAEAAAEPGEAASCYAQARAPARAHADAFFEAIAARGMASAAIDQGDLPGARALLLEAVALSRQVEGTTIAYGTLLAHFARLAAAEGEPERALRLASAALAVRQETGTQLHAYDRDLVERSVEPARRLLGPKAAAAVWAEGQGMTLEEALAYALAPPSEAGDTAGARIRPSRSLIAQSASALTPREREVAMLVAGGWTNRQIAAELVISSGTAKRHIENILGKLGLASRAQLPAWAAQQDMNSAASQPAWGTASRSRIPSAVRS